MSKSKRFFALKNTVLVALTLLAACAVETDPKVPLEFVPSENFGLSAAPQPAASWQTVAHPVLRQLFSLAVVQSPDLSLAQAQVRAAQAGLMLTSSNENLSGIAHAELQRQRFSEVGLLPPPIAGTWVDLGGIGLDATYQFDFWHGLQAQTAAAEAQSLAAKWEAQDVAAWLASAITAQYLALCLADDIQKIAVLDTELSARLLQQTNIKHRAGLVSVDDVHQAEWTWAEAKKIQLESEEQVTTLRQNLAVLVGEAPQFGASIAIVPVDSLPPLPKALELNELGNRADIQAAKHRATAAAQDVKAARARFYPNISLSGSVGLSSIELSKLLDAGSWVATVVPAISLPIFSQTALNAQLSGQQAAYDVAVAVYNKTVIHAASEASLAVTRLNNAKQEQALIQDQVSRASALAHTAESRYKAGLSDASSYQLAKRRALQQQMRLAMVKTDVLLAHTQLLRHLGATLN